MIKKYIFKRETPYYSGHFAVTRSLIEGLQKTGTQYVYNPKQVSKLTDHVHVLGGVNTLKYAIRLKKQGKIRRLTAGPNIVVLSSDFKGLVGAKEIDLYLVNSEWTKNAYLIDNSKLEGKINFFPSGINPEFWKIKKNKNKQLRVAFYKKRAEPILYQECLLIAKQHNAVVTEIIYGTYDLEDLKSVLANVDFVIYFVEQESQGIALAEIWATDTPTIVWNPGFWSYQLKNYQSSSAPYISDDTGLFFRTANDFRDLFEKDHLKAKNFQPQNWVLNNMTDQICTLNF